MGYLSCSLQWLFSIMLYFSWLKALILFISPNVNNKTTTAITPIVLPGPVITVVSVIIVTSMVAITLYYIYKIPATIIKTSKKTVQQTAKTVAPLILKVQHKKDTKKNLFRLTPRLVVVLKLTLVIIPLVLALISVFITNQIISYGVVTVLGCWLAGASILFFSAQYLLAHFLSVKAQDVW